MKKSWKLANGIDRHSESPESFLIPSKKEKNQLKIGDTVKLIFEFGSDKLDNSGAERMWVEITKMNKNKLEGRLDNEPYEIEDLKCDDKITFNYDHIIDIYEKIESSNWLSGGEYIELSFVKEIDINRSSFAKNIIIDLKNLGYGFEIAIDEVEQDKLIDSFEKGNSDEDENDIFYYNIKIPVWLNISGKRKAVLSFFQISDSLVMIGLDFCWNEFLPDSEMDELYNAYEIYFQELFKMFNFPIGMLAIEDWILSVFDANESYNLKNINPGLIRHNCIIREDIITIDNFSFYKNIGNGYIKKNT